MPRGAEAHALRRVGGVGRVVAVGREQAVDVDEVFGPRELARARVDAHATSLPGGAGFASCNVARPSMPASPSDPVILVAGEALFDLVLADSAELAAHPGGGPFNAARAIARLEQPTAYLGRVSRDRFGGRLRALLAEDGVRLDTVVDTDDPTTLALAELDAGGSATYRFYAEGTSAFGLVAEAALAALPPAVDMLHVGTSFSLDPVASALEAVTAHVAGQALVMLDPNCRPTVIADPGAYRARIGRVARQRGRRQGVRRRPRLPRSRHRADHGGPQAARGRCGRRAADPGRRGRGGGDGGRDRHGARAARRGRRHDRRGRRVRRRLPRLLAPRGLRARAAGEPRRARRGDRVRLPGRGSHLRAPGRLAAAPSEL